MIRLLLIGLLFCLLIDSALAQSAEPFRKANYALVTYDTMSVTRAFQAVGQTLVAMGYTISKSDNDFLTIETNIRKSTGNAGSATISVVIRASIKANDTGRAEVKLSGVFGYPDTVMPNTEIANRGMKGSPFMISFEKLQAVVEQLKRTNPSKSMYGVQ